MQEIIQVSSLVVYEMAGVTVLSEPNMAIRVNKATMAIETRPGMNSAGMNMENQASATKSPDGKYVLSRW